MVLLNEKRGERHAYSSTNTIRPKAALWTGYALSAFGVLFMLIDSGGKIATIQPVVDTFALLDYPISAAVGLGVLTIIILILYLIPRTSILGAVLMTGYLGGAIATQVRVGAGLFPLVFPLFIGALFWGGLYLRDPRVREILPLRSVA